MTRCSRIQLSAETFLQFQLFDLKTAVEMNYDPVSTHVEHDHQDTRKNEQRILKLAIKATWHCLLGCGIGEVAGMAISAAAGLGNLYSIIVSVLLGFAGGLLLGIVPLVRAGFNSTKAIRVVIIGEGLGITVMEAFEVMTQLVIPGVMEAHLTDLKFWAGMLISLLIGFIAALPVNYALIRKGIRHIH